MEHQSTSELILALDADYQECYRQLLACLDEGERQPDGTLAVDDQFVARQIIRATFAYIEGVTYVLKLAAVVDSDETGYEMPAHEAQLAFEVGYRLDDRGRVRQEPAKLGFLANVRFAFRLYEKTHGASRIFDPSKEWWACLVQAVKVRDRLTHPKWAEDLDVEPSELIAAIKAKVGFDDTISALPVAPASEA